MTAVAWGRARRSVKRSLRSIVVPLDGSKLAEHALPVAGAIAGAARARVRLVLVHQLPPPPMDNATAGLYVSIEAAIRQSQRDYLRHVAVRLRDAWGIRVTTVIPEGPIAPTLAAWIDDVGADLVVMTTHGRGAIGRAFVGSIADHVVRTAEAPVVLVGPDAGGAKPAVPKGWRPREILVPLDGSPLAETALPPAVELARLFRAPITLVQVIQPLSVATDPPMAFPAVHDEQITAIRRREAQDYLDSTAERLRGDGVEVSGAATIGWSVAGTLLELARPERTGLLAMATHGRGGLKRLIVGSVADKLVRAAEVPVLVVRPKGRRG
jgi:nucleotide-binding universal stress UspA family protein